MKHSVDLEKYQIRTDLAIESIKNIDDISEEIIEDDIKITKVIIDEKIGKEINKKQGNYVTIEFLDVTDSYNYEKVKNIFVREFKKFLNDHKDFVIYMIIFKNFPDLLDDRTHEELKNFVIENFDAKSKDSVKSLNYDFVKLVKEHMQNKNISENQLIEGSNVLPHVINDLFTDAFFIPSKNLALAIGVGLELNEEDLIKLLSSIGYTDIKNSVVALVVLFFIKEKIFDIYKINCALFTYEAKPLGLE